MKLCAIGTASMPHAYQHRGTPQSIPRDSKSRGLVTVCLVTYSAHMHAYSLPRVFEPRPDSQFILSSHLIIRPPCYLPLCSACLRPAHNPTPPHLIGLHSACPSFGTCCSTILSRAPVDLLGLNPYNTPPAVSLADQTYFNQSRCRT